MAGVVVEWWNWPNDSIAMCFLQQSLGQFDDVYVDHMGITEDDTSAVVLWTDRFVDHCRLLAETHTKSLGHPALMVCFCLIII